MANPRENLTFFLFFFAKIRVRSEESEKSHSSLRTILLLSQTELCNDSTVALDIYLLEITEKVLSVTDHLLKAAAAVCVVVVLFEVFGEVLDSVGQKCDLNFGRTRVALVSLVLVDDLKFGFCVHVFFTFLFIALNQGFGG